MANSLYRISPTFAVGDHMKKLVLTVAVAVLMLAGVVFAQNTSTTQMQLVNSTVFTNRLQYNGSVVMAEVLAEAQSAAANGVIPAYTAACHTKRAVYASNFLLSPASYSSQSAVLISSANISGAVIVGTVTGSGPTADSTATDGALQQAYRVFMNTFAGCVINP